MTSLPSSHPEEYINLRLSYKNTNHEPTRYAVAGSNQQLNTQRDSPDYIETTFKNKNPSPSYLYLQEELGELGGRPFDDHNYYEAIRYDSTHHETSKPRIKILIIIIAILISILILASAILGGVIYSKRGSKSKLQSDPQFCTTERDEAETLKCRRLFIRNMTSSAFNAYRRYAWGGPELRPVTLKSFIKTKSGNYPGLTIVDSMSTLWVMDLKEEWNAGKEWIADQMPPFAEINAIVDTKEMVLDYLGGILSAYALSGEEVFFQRAIEVYEALKPAFINSTGMLPNRFNPKKATGEKMLVKRDDEPLIDQFLNSTSRTATTESSLTNSSKTTNKPTTPVFAYSISTKTSTVNFLAYIGFQQPELIYLANLTGDQQMSDQLEKNRFLMRNIPKYRGLYMSRVDISSEEELKWNTTWATLMDISTDFYYNMIRSYVQLKSRDSDILEMYGEAIDSALAANLFSTIDGQLFTRVFDISSHLYSDFMYDNSCLLGGMFALSSEIFRKINSTTKAKVHLELAVNLTDTCHLMATNTRTKLLPYNFWRHTILNNGTWIKPYLAETYFLLYRVTGDTKYQNWAWELAQALYNHCRVAASGGFSNIKDVNAVPTEKTYDNQPAEFLSGTLKYLYLTFSEQSVVLPLDQWFFNSRGHPLPICASSDRYPAKMCEPQHKSVL